MRTSLCSVALVLAEGALVADSADSDRLFDALNRNDADRIRSLKWREPVDPARCWFSGAD